MKKILAILCAVCMIFALSATAFAADSYSVGICQLVQHPALDAATQGFIDALTEALGEDAVDFNTQNASGDPATCSIIVSQFISDEVDLIMANATPALLATQATNTIPVLGTSVTDYASAYEVEDWAARDVAKNVSGTSDGVPAEEYAKLLNELFPDAKNVGILYCSGEPNSLFQADQIRPFLEEMGYKVKDYTFSDSNDVYSSAVAACDDSDVLYIPTDNTAASNAELINSVVLEKKVPVVAGEENLCIGCGCVTLSISYYDLGVVTGQMAAKILTGEAEVGDMPIEYAPFEKKFNAVNCELNGIELPEDFVAIETEG